MKALLEGLIGELQVLKNEGVQSVSVSDETMASLTEAAKEICYAGAEEISQPEPKAAVAAPAKPAMPDAVAKIVASLPEPPVVELPSGSKDEQYQWLRKRVLECPTCNEHVKPGKKVVIGSGNLDSDIFFCGEAPGADEEIEGEVFVGKAGQLLTKIIQAMGLKRTGVYIGNIMNWRPEVEYGNRPPTKEEMDFCLPYLEAQLSIVKPKIIVALGKTAAEGLLKPEGDFTVGSLRGKFHEYMGIPLVVSFHPSYLLRNQQMRSKRMAWEDMMMVMEKINMPISDKQRNFFKK